MQFRFRSRDRLKQQSDFDRVYSDGIHAADHVLVVRATANSDHQTRLGLSVSRRVGGAVQRNRWKRLIREAFRTKRVSIPSGYDYVVRPRRGANPEFERIVESLPRLAKRIARKLENSSP